MADQKDIWDELERAFDHGSLDEEMFELLSAYLDDACSHKERRLVEAYLEEIPSAKRVLAELRYQSSLIRTSEEPPFWLRESILSKTTRRFSLPVFALRASPVAALILPMVVLGFWFLNGDIRGRSGQEFKPEKTEFTLNSPNDASVELPPQVRNKQLSNRESQSLKNRRVSRLERPNKESLLAKVMKPNLALSKEPKRNAQPVVHQNSPSSGDLDVSAGLIQRQKPLPEPPDVVGLISESQDALTNENDSTTVGSNVDSKISEYTGAKTFITKSAIEKLREKLKEINSKGFDLPLQSKENMKTKADRTQQEKNEGGERNRL